MDKRYSPYRKRTSTRQSKSTKPLFPADGGGSEFHSNWSVEEDEKLRDGVLQFGGKKWKTIAQRIPNRTAQQCNRRWNQLQSVGAVVKKPWSEQEDSEMQRLVAKYGPSKWAVIASYLPGRNGKQCRERWHNQLNPSIKKGPWTEEEDNIILEMQSKYGNCWAKITQRLPGRTDNAVKNHWHSSMKGKKKHREALLANGVKSASEEAITKLTIKPRSKPRGTGSKRYKRSTARKGAKKVKRTPTPSMPSAAVSPTSVSAVDVASASTGTWDRLGWCYAVASLLASEELEYSSEEVKPAASTVLVPHAILDGDEVCDSILAESEDEHEMLFTRTLGTESEEDVELTASSGVPAVGPSVFDDAMRSWKSETASPESSISCSPPCFSLSPDSDAKELDDEDDDLPAFYNQGISASNAVTESIGCGMASVKMEYPDAEPSSNLVAEEAFRVDAGPFTDSFLRPGLSSLSALMLARDSEDEKELLRAAASDCDSFGSELDAAAMATVDAPLMV